MINARDVHEPEDERLPEEDEEVDTENDDLESEEGDEEGLDEEERRRLAHGSESLVAQL
jgi:hypothetical protein